MINNLKPQLQISKRRSSLRRTSQRARAYSLNSPSLKLIPAEQLEEIHSDDHAGDDWYALASRDIAAFSIGLTETEHSDSDMTSVNRQHFTNGNDYLKPFANDRLDTESVGSRLTSVGDASLDTASDSLEMPSMNLTAAEFKPIFGSGCTANHEHGPEEFEPTFKIKTKTELCKFWLHDGMCQYGYDCAFAHGVHELQKKQHVTSQYRMNHCQAFNTAPNFCQYGSRCTYAHVKTDFSDFKSGEVSRYTMLMHENTTIMASRINKAAEPDVTVFNVAMPNKTRLPIFEEIHDSQKVSRKKRRARKTRRGSERTAATTTTQVNFVPRPTKKEIGQAMFDQMMAFAATAQRVY